MDKLDSYLRQGIWHATSLHGFRGIIEDQFIRPNIYNQFKDTYPQSANSIGRINQYISLFDFESVSEDIFYDSIIRMQYMSIIYSHEPFTILLNLDRNQLNKLIPYDAVVNKEYKVAIYKVECFYPEYIPISCITKVLILDDIVREDVKVLSENFTYSSIRAAIKIMCEDRKRAIEAYWQAQPTSIVEIIRRGSRILSQNKK